MKLNLFFLLIVFTLNISSQNTKIYYEYKTALLNPDSVIILSINCLHNNSMNTDGCDSIPDFIYKLKNLEELYIIETNINKLPTVINKLSKLKILNLSYNSLLDYDKELCNLYNLDHLEYLNISWAKLEYLPICLTNLKSIKSLNLSFNNFIDISNLIFMLSKFPNLNEIDLSGIDSLLFIPENINQLNKLKTLNLSYYDKKLDLVKSFYNLRNQDITEIKLQHNGLQKIPLEIINFKNLNKINLSENYFDSIPYILFEINTLKEINIQSNNNTLKYISQDIQKLSNLEKLNIALNPLIIDRETIINLSKLKSLKELDLFGCSLKSIPYEIGNFKNLEKLNLSRNPQIDFKQTLYYLSKIKTMKYLDLSDNNLTTLPKEIGLLKNLETLIIGLNPINELPDEFYYLNNLKFLYVYGNYDSEMSNETIQVIQTKLPKCLIIKDWVFRTNN